MASSSMIRNRWSMCVHDPPFVGVNGAAGQGPPLVLGALAMPCPLAEEASNPSVHAALQQACALLQMMVSAILVSSACR